MAGTTSEVRLVLPPTHPPPVGPTWGSFFASTHLKCRVLSRPGGAYLREVLRWDLPQKLRKSPSPSPRVGPAWGRSFLGLPTITPATNLCSMLCFLVWESNTKTLFVLLRMFRVLIPEFWHFRAESQWKQPGENSAWFVFVHCGFIALFSVQEKCSHIVSMHTSVYRVHRCKFQQSQGSHRTWKIWKTWKNRSRPGKPGKTWGLGAKTWKNIVKPRKTFDLTLKKCKSLNKKKTFGKKNPAQGRGQLFYIILKQSLPKTSDNSKFIL